MNVRYSFRYNLPWIITSSYVKFYDLLAKLFEKIIDIYHTNNIIKYIFTTHRFVIINVYCSNLVKFWKIWLRTILRGNENKGSATFWVLEFKFWVSPCSLPFFFSPLHYENETWVAFQVESMYFYELDNWTLCSYLRIILVEVFETME